MNDLYSTVRYRTPEISGERVFFPLINDIDGNGKANGKRMRSRIAWIMAMVMVLYSFVGGRLIYLGSQSLDQGSFRFLADASMMELRPDLIDRHGETLATDIKTYSLYAEPRRIIDADEAIEQLSTVLANIDFESMYKRLSSDAGFVWLRRELTPKQRNEIIALGVPGIGFRSESLRFYPNGNTASHIVGHVNVDNVGIAGMEKYVDGQAFADLHTAGFALRHNLDPIRLSIDIRIQHFVRDELMKGMNRYQAIAAGAVVLDVHTGEILAMASVPDYDPNHPSGALRVDRINRMSAGLFEMGSVFKTFTTAMALDSGMIGLKDRFDASQPIQISGYGINDFHAKRRSLTVPEIFIYSSNIGAAKMADKIGIVRHQAFLEKLGLLSRMELELPEIATPLQPKKWKKINAITIAYGHGVQTTPLQTAVAAAAMVNGGKLISPTLLVRSKEKADKLSRQIISSDTSDAMRYLMRLNVLEGSGKHARVQGYRVGGKTGTAEKVVNGKYSDQLRFNSFLAAFPIENPRYLVLTIIDEPKVEQGQKSATAGLNAAPITAAIIRRSAAVLGVKPILEKNNNPLLVSY